MSKLLIFDTETTGILTNADPTKPHARVVQLAAKLIKVDSIPAYGEVVPTIHTFKSVVNSEVDIPEGASNVHGITNAHMQEYGINHLSMLDVFADLVVQADAYVGHNLNYDIRVMAHAFHLEGFQGSPFGTKPVFDTMKMATPICKIPKSNARSSTDFRWPKLTIAWKFFKHIEEEKANPAYSREAFEEILELTVANAHDAMEDVNMSLDIFFAICRLTGNNYGIGV